MENPEEAAPNPLKEIHRSGCKRKRATYDVRPDLPSGDSVHSDHGDGNWGYEGCGGLL